MGLTFIQIFVTVLIIRSYSCPIGWSQDSLYTNTCYYFVNNPLPWQNASTFCSNLLPGATLPIFHSFNEYQSYHNFMKSNGQMSCNDITWIGLNYNYSSNVSLWIDNSVLSFDGLWATAQPSNNGKCVSHFAWGGFWLTQQCNSTGGTDTFFCQLRTIPETTTLASETTKVLAQDCPTCPNGWVLDDSGICYLYVSKTTMGWSTAKNYCQTTVSGASLPIFRTPSESLSYLKLLEQLLVPCVYYQWLSMTDSAQEGVFLWTDNSTPSFFQWSQGAPSTNTAQNCVASSGWLTPNSSWSDQICTRPLSFLCQLRIEVNCSHTTTVSSTSVLSTNVGSVTSTFESSTYMTTGERIMSDSTPYTNSFSAQITTSSSVVDLFTTETVAVTNSSTTDKISLKDLITSSTKNMQNYNTSTTVSSSILQIAGINSGVQSDFLSTISTAQDAIPFLMASVNDSVKAEIGHQFYEMVISCSYSSESCDSVDNFKQTCNPMLGNCFTFNSGTEAKYYVARAGAPYGLRLVLYASQSDYMCTSLQAGFKVAIDENNLQSFPDSEGYYVTPGTVAYFNLRQTQMSRLSSPYGTCADQNFAGFNGTYTVEACQRQCYQNYVLESCKCADPRYELPFGTTYCTLSQKGCLDFSQSCEDDIITSMCKCPPRCSETVFQASITTATFLAKDLQGTLCDGVVNQSSCLKSFQSGFALVYMFYDSLNYLSYVEEPAYPIMNLLGDFSGVTGLLLGLCVMSIFEFAMFVYMVAYGLGEKMFK